MFNGKMKAVTFSYDDGVTQDRMLIDMLNRYSLKGTFNINSGLLGTNGSLFIQGKTVAHVKPRPEEIAKIYEGHEIAAHTLTHPLLTQLDEQEILRQVCDDTEELSRLAGYKVQGMAYPCGGKNYDSRVSSILAEKSEIKYARTIECNASFDLQDNLMEFKPTVYHMDWDKLFSLAEEFIALKPDRPKLFYIFGHSYEFDVDNTWGKFEEFCRLISGKDDIFYGTNSEVLLG